MSYGANGIDMTFSASGDLNTAQFRFVTWGGSDKYVIQATGASNPYPIGVLQNDPKDGEAARVRIFGPTQVYVDAAASAITYGAHLSCGSTGLAVPGTEPPSGSGALSVGIAMQSVSSGSGILAEVLLIPSAVKLGAS